MSGKCYLPRRTFLRGMGTMMALPMFEAMRPVARAARGEEGTNPIRTAFIFFPNGAIMPHWKPEGSGTQWELSRTLQPLRAYQDQLTVFTGLTQHHGRANGDGAGDHARCASSFLTRSGSASPLSILLIATMSGTPAAWACWTAS